MSSPLKRLKSSGGMELKSVLIFLRHGARTPIRLESVLPVSVRYEPELIKKLPECSYPYRLTNLYTRKQTDIESSYDAAARKVKLPGGSEVGQLTALGQQQSVELGRRLRREYIQNHNLNVGHNNLFLRTSNVRRCVMTLESTLNGLLSSDPNSAVQNGTGSKLVDPQPIDIFTLPNEQETLYPNTEINLIRIAREDGYNYWNARVAASEEYSEVCRGLGFSPSDRSRPGARDVLLIRDEIACRRAHGFAVTDSGPLSDELAGSLNALGVLVEANALASSKYDSNTLQIICGKNFVMIEKFISESVLEESKYKMHLISAHDSTIMPLLIMLGIFDKKWPAYCSSLAFELHHTRKTGPQSKSDSSEYFVRIMYCHKEIPLHGETFVPLQTFLDTIQPFTISEARYKVMCDTFKPKLPFSQTA